MGRSPCCVKEGLKKGPWTQEEDDKLIAFVKEHGHGNWRALPKKCGLLRCGKSCRLRWNNYLRPDIKRGMFTQSEEQKIFQLHALVGNKWAFIASQLPKRTDNEIKNYWNTVLKKRLQKERVNSLMSFGALRTLTSPLAVPEARLRQDTKSTQRQDDRNNVKSSAGSSASKKLSCNSSAASSVMSCAHLAQWESARLEAEARLAKESQSSRKTHALFSFTAATAISALSNHTHTNHQPLAAQLSTCLIPNTLPSSSSNPGCLIHSLHPSSTISPLLSSSDSSLSLPSCRCAASTNSSSTSMSSKTLLSSLRSQENIASALTLGPNGRLSWQAKELTFTPSSPSTSQSSLISQMLCQIERDHNGSEEVITNLQAIRKDGGLKGEDVLRGGQVDMSLEEATSSIILDLNSTNMESSSLDSWHDFIWDVENSCSDVVSPTTVVSTSPPGEQFSHGAPASCKTTTSEGLCSSSLDLEGLDFDSFISCEHYNSSQHHTSLLILKELLWDTPPSLSISSSSIVN